MNNIRGHHIWKYVETDGLGDLKRVTESTSFIFSEVIPKLKALDSKRSP